YSIQMGGFLKVAGVLFESSNVAEYKNSFVAMNWVKEFWKGLTTPMSREGETSFEGSNQFSDHAKKSLAMARLEAERLNHNFVGTEHLLLGLIRLAKGTAVAVLVKMGLDLDFMKQEIERQVGFSVEGELTRNVPFTPRVKKVIALAAKEARELKHQQVGTEH